VIRWVGFVVGVAALSAGAFFGYTQLGGAAGDPFEAAGHLVPADTHVFVAVNTDVTSDPWRALPDLLSRIGVLEDALEERDSALAESGLDYQQDVEPVLGTIRAAALAVQATTDTSAEVVGIVDSRDPTAIVSLMDRMSVGFERQQSTDDVRQLDVIAYSDATSSAVLARKSDLLYFAEDLADIQSFLDRLDTAGPLSVLSEYQHLREQSPDDALMLTYLSGTALDALDTAGILDELAPTMGIDPRGIKALVSSIATPGGFELHGVATTWQGWGESAAHAASDGQLLDHARATPAEAQLFVAGVGLRDALETTLEAFYYNPFVEPGMLLAPLEEAIGIDVRTGLLPLFSGTFSVAGRLDELETQSGWVVFQTESSDPAALESALQRVVAYLEMECACSTGIVVERPASFVRVRWPATPLPASSLADDSGFVATRAQLPAANLSLLYFNARALTKTVVDSVAPEAGSVRFEQLPGIGVAQSISNDIARFSVVMPVGKAP
jgi:hypothetical protein